MNRIFRYGKPGLLVMFSVLLFLGANVAARADAVVDANDTLVCFVIDTRPFAYLDTDGTAKGIQYDLLGELSKRTGIKFERKITPYARVWDDLDKGLKDCGIIWRTKTQDAKVEYVSYIFTDYLSAFTIKGGKVLNKYEDLYNMSSVALLRGSVISDKFNNDKQIKIYEVNSYDQAFKMLTEKRVDAAAGNAYAYIYFANLLKVKEELDLPGIQLGVREQWLQMSKKSKFQKYIPNLQKGIESLMKDGTIEKINLQYYGDKYKSIKFVK
jgi:polar amino acid transport system substrate-binding protein